MIVEANRQPLVSLLRKWHPSGQLLHLTLDLQEYKFQLAYCIGATNLIVDGLSCSEIQATRFNETILLPIPLDRMAAFKNKDLIMNEITNQLYSPRIVPLK